MSRPAWVERMPPSWAVRRLRHVATPSNSNVDKKSYADGIPVRLCNYTDVYYHEYIRNDLDFLAATATPQEIRRFALRKSDVIITKDSESWDDIAIPACVWEDLDNVVCGYHLALLRPHGKMTDARFLMRCLQATGIREQFWLAANGVTRFGLSQMGMKDALLPIPPLPTQKAIADFLDRKTAAIDALIEKKQKLLDLLAEKRAALINQAVTKGLDPTVPMKDSGIPWIGEIPAHWEVVSWRYLVDILTDYVANGSFADLKKNVQYLNEPGFARLIRLTDIRAGLPAESAIYVSEDAYRFLGKSRLSGGEFLIASVGAHAGFVVRCPPLSLPGTLGPNMMMAKFNAGLVNSRFMLLAANSDYIQAQLRTFAQQSSAQPKLNKENFRTVVMLRPPTVEQGHIATYVEVRSERILEMTKKIRHQQDRLQEYRQALITAAVTGRLEIPEEAA